MRWTKHGGGQWAYWTRPDGHEVVPISPAPGEMKFERLDHTGRALGVYDKPKDAKCDNHS